MGVFSGTWGHGVGCVALEAAAGGAISPSSKKTIPSPSMRASCRCSSSTTTLAARKVTGTKTPLHTGVQAKFALRVQCCAGALCSTTIESARHCVRVFQQPAKTLLAGWLFFYGAAAALTASGHLVLLKRRTKTHKDTDNFLVTVGANHKQS
jgi:hypothetical protein